MSPRGRPPLVTAAVACFVVGAGVLLAFDKAVTLVLGIVLLLAFIVLGVFAIASPDYLARETDEPPG